MVSRSVAPPATRNPLHLLTGAILVCLASAAQGEANCRVKGAADGVYTGGCNGGWAEGQGVLAFANGARFEGEWHDGNLTGRGVMANGKGYRYEGDWIDGIKQGKGVEVLDNGQRYEGDFAAGKRTGKGIYQWPNGERYEGDFRNNTRHGQGVHRWPDGDRYEGTYAENRQTGKATYVWSNGDRYEGDFVDGKRTGLGIYLSAAGWSEEGYFQDGKLNGLGIRIAKDGTVEEGRFAGGKLQSRESVPRLAIPRFDDWIASLEPISIGGGSCSTVRSAVVQGPGRIAVVVRRPVSSCSFASLRLLIGNDNLSLAGLRGFRGTDDGKSSRWAAPSGVMFFDTRKSYTRKQLESAALWEDSCKDVSCLTDSGNFYGKNQGMPADARSTIKTGRPEPLRPEWYRDGHAKAGSIEAMVGFAVLFTDADPDGLVPGVVQKLRQQLLGQGDWDSLKMAWEYAPDKAVLARLVREAKTPAAKKELEELVMAKVPPSALFEAGPVAFEATQGSRKYGSGKVDIQYYDRQFKGVARVRLSPSSPVKLTHNSYEVSVTYTLKRPFEQFGQGWFTQDETYTHTQSITKTIVLSPANKYSAPVPLDFAEQRLAYADRGELGGYTRQRLSQEPFLTITVNNYARSE